jgi:predicted nucleic-acid-binding Zn-ribbon protein
MSYPNSSGTKCPKCEWTSFELLEDTPTGTNFVQIYMRCSKCKTFLQALPYAQTNVLIDTLQKDINKIKNKLAIPEDIKPLV